MSGRLNFGDENGTGFEMVLQIHYVRRVESFAEFCDLRLCQRGSLSHDRVSATTEMDRSGLLEKTSLVKSSSSLIGFAAALLVSFYESIWQVAGEVQGTGRRCRHAAALP